MAEFAGKVAIITGASSGIGQTAAVLFAKRGAKVAIVARSKDKLALVEKQCIEVSKRENVLVIAADVTKMEDLKRIVEETVKAFKQIDILVNNAGASDAESIMTTTLESYDNMMNLNTRAPLFLIQHCVPHLAETKGCIVNVSTIGAFRGFPTVTTYTMAKAAMDQLTRAAAVELGPKGIRVNSLNPGLVDTNFAAAAGYTEQQFEATKSYIVNKTPVGRPGTAEDIAECILFLASKKASFVDGINLIADGGVLAVA